MFKLIAALTFALAGGDAHEPTPPKPPAGPTAPKEPEAPSAARKSDKPAAKTETGKAADAAKPEAKKEPGKADAPKAETPKDQHEGEEAHGHEGHAEKPSKKGRTGKAARADKPPPPALTGGALRQELRQSGGEEKGAPLSERAKLEQMASEIAKAREALKQDTARLEAMLRGGGGDGRMPLGDPTAPVAVGGPAASKEAMKEQILTVSKAMKGMKPEQAAAIISRLDRVLASEILRRMKPADAGAVMASIKPELAAELATAIATRKSMVEEDQKGGRK